MNHRHHSSIPLLGGREGLLIESQKGDLVGEPLHPVIQCSAPTFKLKERTPEREMRQYYKAMFAFVLQGSMPGPGYPQSMAVVMLILLWQYMYMYHALKNDETIRPKVTCIIWGIRNVV